MAEPARYEFAGNSKEKPLTLVGPPGKLAGLLDLHSLTDVDLVLRDTHLEDPSGRLSILPARKSSTIVLRPNQERRVEVTVAVDPSTPAGQYDAQLNLAGRTRPVILQVLETFDLTVQPKSLVLLNLPGEPQTKQVAVTNDGNVRFAIGDLADADLEDDTAGSALRVTVERMPGALPDSREVLAISRNLRENAYKEAGLSIRKTGEPVEVAPGERALVDFEMTLRADLPPGSRYRGVVPVLTRDLEIIVVSAGGGRKKSPPPAQLEPAPAAKAPKTKKT